MYFFNAEKVAEQFRTNAIDDTDKVIYFLSLLVQLILGITVFNILPILYHTLFYFAQSQLNEAIQLPNLKLDVYHTIDYIMPLFSLLLCPTIFIMLYILYCKYDNQRAIPDFIERVVSLSFPITIRIITITSIVFLVAVFYEGFYFNSQLLMLEQKVNVEYRGLQSLYRLFNKINIFSWIWKGIATLKEAEAIFIEMNRCSWYFYWASQLLAALSALRYFYELKKYLAKSY